MLVEVSGMIATGRTAAGSPRHNYARSGRGAQRAMLAMLGMGKLDIAALHSAADGVPAT